MGQFAWGMVAGLGLAGFICIPLLMRLSTGDNPFQPNHFIPILHIPEEIPIEKDLERYETLAKSRAGDPMTSGETFRDYCKAWRSWEKDNCQQRVDLHPDHPRVFYCNSFDVGGWLDCPAIVDAGKGAGGSLVIIILEGGSYQPHGEREKYLPIAGVLVRDPEEKNLSHYSALIPGHYRWGQEVSTDTVMFLPSPSSPCGERGQFWCRVWATGSRTIVSQGQNYTLVHSAEEISPDHQPAQPAVLLHPQLRETRLIPNTTNCTTFGFPLGRRDLISVDGKVVDCGSTFNLHTLNNTNCTDFQFPDMSNLDWTHDDEVRERVDECFTALKSNLSALLPRGSYFCAELEQNYYATILHFVGIIFDTNSQWIFPEQGTGWPLFCHRNLINAEGGGAFLAGFLRHVNKWRDGRSFGLFMYLDF